MSLYVVDVESDGAIPFKYSMVCFGAVKVDRKLETTFYGKTKPISKQWNPEALAISGFSRQEHENFDDPAIVMRNFKDWINATNTSGKPIFITDNLGYDWSFINFYFHWYLETNPFGFSGRRINDLYSGLLKDVYKSSEWKKFKKTRHDHMPVNDAKGNAEAIIYMVDKLGLNFKLD